MTTTIATAKAILLPRNSGVMNGINEGKTCPVNLLIKKTESSEKNGCSNANTKNIDNRELT
jgi:hypothetical protein